MATSTDSTEMMAAAVWSPPLHQMVRLPTSSQDPWRHERLTSGAWFSSSKTIDLTHISEMHQQC